MKKRILSFAVAAAMVFSLSANILTVFAADSTTVVRLDPSNASPFNDGKFQGWGTSLCWWANRIGYSDKLTQQAADAFFSEDGLGLDIARYNLGGGDDPTHNHITRSDSKIPCYATKIDDSGNYIYDWTVDANQRAVAKAAQAANPDLYFEGFSNSPPWFITNSGCSSGATNASNDNLASENYDNFGKFIAEVTKHFKTDFGIEFKSYSPMNEPDTSYWGSGSNKQEGAHYSPGNTQSGTIVATRNALNAEGLTDVLVAGMDETNIDSTVTNLDKLTDTAKTALGRIDTHTYKGSKRAQLKAKAVEMNKDLWMSEVDSGWDGFGISEQIIADMNGMQPAAWVIWDIIDSHKDNTSDMRVSSEAKNSLNVTGAMWGVGMADHDTGTLELANKYYFYGQFTRYINPGDTIIASSDSTLAAYNKDSGDIKIVALNSSGSDKPYEFDLSAFSTVGGGVKEIRTNNATGVNSEHWKEIPDEAALSNKKLTTTLKAGTVTTYVIGDFISIGGGDERVSIGQTVNLTANSTEDVSGAVWSVSDSSIASVTQDGKLTGKKPGKVTVTVQAGDIKGTRDFTVYFEITGSSKIAVGEEYDYTVGEYAPAVTWSVSDDNAASVTEDGKVTAKKTGSFTLTARTADGVTASVEITAANYSQKYTGTDYSYVKNILSATNDFNDGDLNGFITSGNAGLAEDNAGVSVLGVQTNGDNKKDQAASGSAELSFNPALTCSEDQLINMAFDVYISNSGGTADVGLYGSDYATIMKLHYYGWNNFDMDAGATSATETSQAGPYLRNDVNDESGVQKISNGAHVEIYYKPSSGVVKVTLKNNTNTAAAKEYVGRTFAGTDITRLAFSANFTTWSKPMYVDNLVTNIVTCSADFDDVDAPAPTARPVLPSSGELINLNFDNKDLTSTSPYGAAEAVGTAKFAEVDDKTCLELDGTKSTAIKLTDSNGNSLLTGQENLTISFKAKPTTSDTSWWLFAAPSDDKQVYKSEKYIGALTNGGNITVERYNNSGARSDAANGSITANAWNDILIRMSDGKTTVYVNGEKQGSVSSSVNIADMLGGSSVAYIGLANWKDNNPDGEFATGYIDDFVIYNYALPTVQAYRSGDTIAYTSDYSEDGRFDMYVAVHDKKGALVGAGNTENGIITVPDADGEYTVTQYVWEDMKPAAQPVEITPDTVAERNM